MQQSNYPPSLTRALPCTTLTADNVAEHELALVGAIGQATFIALDLEFTGLSPALRTGDIEQRYSAACKNASEYAVLAVGLSLFIQEKNIFQEIDSAHRWNVDSYNILMRKEGVYSVSTRSLRFLASQGFDFQHQILSGIGYLPGTLSTDQPVPKETQILRRIFAAVLQSGAPVIVHNGFLDLVMFYNAIHASLPPKLDSFVADCYDLFKGGIFDTKLIAECKENEKKTVLSYLFRKCERIQYQWATHLRNSIQITFCSPLVDSPKVKKVKSDALCDEFAKYGFCRLDLNCEFSHDIDKALDYFFESQARKRRRKSGNNDNSSQKKQKLLLNDKTTVNNEMNDSSTIIPDTSTTVDPITSTTLKSFEAIAHIHAPKSHVDSTFFHSAHTDAVMTGYIFAHQLYQGWISMDNVRSSAMPTSDSLWNKIYLMNKSFPLLIKKSQYVQCSTTTVTDEATVVEPSKVISAFDF